MEESLYSSYQPCPLAPCNYLNQSRDRNAEQKTKKKWELKMFQPVASSPTQATSQHQGPELIFYMTSGKITTPAQHCPRGWCEVIINSSKFNSEGLGDKQFPYNLQLGRKHPRQLGIAATLDEMTRSYKLKGLGPKNDPSKSGKKMLLM